MMMRIKLLSITENIHKIIETKIFLEKLYPDLRFEIDPVPESIPKIEIQSNDLEDIALFSLKEAFKYIKDPDNWDIIFREDAGLFIEVLNGFPGPYSSYVYRTIGLSGVLKLLEDKPVRKAYFKSAVAYRFRGEDFIRVSTGVVTGSISREIRGSKGFGFDPIFIPSGYEKTFAELGEEIKILISHRSRALREMINNYLSKMNLRATD